MTEGLDKNTYATSTHVFIFGPNLLPREAASENITSDVRPIMPFNYIDPVGSKSRFRWLEAPMGKLPRKRCTGPLFLHGSSVTGVIQRAAVQLERTTQHATRRSPPACHANANKVSAVRMYSHMLLGPELHPKNQPQIPFANISGTSVVSIAGSLSLLWPCLWSRPSSTEGEDSKNLANLWETIGCRV